MNKAVTRADWMELMETDKSFKEMATRALRRVVAELREWQTKDLEIEI